LQLISSLRYLKFTHQKNGRYVSASAKKRRNLTQKGQKCVLDQENTPAKGKENTVIPVKICLLNARSMHVNTRYTKINPTD
jgi:hypothetical protein